MADERKDEDALLFWEERSGAELIEAIDDFVSPPHSDANSQTMQTITADPTKSNASSDSEFLQKDGDVEILQDESQSFDQRPTKSSPIVTSALSIGRMVRYFIDPVSSIVCHQCQEKGHLARDCSRLRNERCRECGKSGHIRQSCPRLRCYKCGNTGHMSRDCTSSRQKPGSNSLLSQKDAQEEEIEEESKSKSFPSVRSSTPFSHRQALSSPRNRQSQTEIVSHLDDAPTQIAPVESTLQPDATDEQKGQTSEDQHEVQVANVPLLKEDFDYYGTVVEPKYKWKTLFHPVDTTPLEEIVPRKVSATDFYTLRTPPPAKPHLQSKSRSFSAVDELLVAHSPVGSGAKTQIPSINAQVEVDSSLFVAMRIAQAPQQGLDGNAIPLMRFRDDEFKAFSIDASPLNTELCCFNCGKSGHNGWSCKSPRIDNILINRRFARNHFRDRERILESHIVGKPRVSTKKKKKTKTKKLHPSQLIGDD
eukprot:TRINITY_DN1391_c0_g2_i7.p1 TRINITY_DN1391_c0_g2~~TRINITY_DN1391_c0_g2_i7.p1  ORF type:complete len:493 (+),score=108.29 TRINITY_DN1391_c0_g2_i7:44-1480(+)